MSREKLFETIAYSTAARRFFYYHHNGLCYDLSLAKTGVGEKQLTAPEKCPHPGAAPLVRTYVPMYPGFGNAPFGVDLNQNMRRKNFTHPMFLFDLIFLLTYRRLPNGPVLWRPHSPMWYHLQDNTPRMPHPSLDNLMWFESESPFITWDPHYQSWRLRMSISEQERRDPEAVFNQHQRTGKRPRVPRSQLVKRISTTFTPWNYISALAAAYDFRYETCRIDPERDPYAPTLSMLPYIPRRANRITGERVEETPRDALVYWTWQQCINRGHRMKINDVVASTLPAINHSGVEP